MKQYERLVYTICYQFTKDHHTAEDLAQETFLSAYAHRASYPADNPKSWLCRIAANKAKDHLKSAYHRRVYACEDNCLATDGTILYMQAERPEALLLSKETIEEIKAEILALKEPYRQAATLFFLQEKSVREIATLLARPEKTVHTQLYRAKQLLQAKLERRP